MKKIVSQIKTINTDFADMATSHINKVTSPASDPTGDSVAPAGKAPPISQYEKQFIVDDLEAGTVIRKAAVHLGLLLDDGVEFGARLNPLRKRGKAKGPGTAGAEEAHHEIRYRQKINIQAHDGTMLSANLFAPDTDNPSQTFPAIVFINSWCMDKHQYLLQARRFARNGYLVLSYSARGWAVRGEW